MVLIGVQFAQVLAVLLLAVSVLLCLLVLVIHANRQAERRVLQPIYLRTRTGRKSSPALGADQTPMPSRGPPPSQLKLNQRLPDEDLDLR